MDLAAHRLVVGLPVDREAALMTTPKVGDVVTWFDIGPMRHYTGTVEKVVSATMLSVRQAGKPNPTTVFLCDLVDPREVRA